MHERTFQLARLAQYWHSLAKQIRYRTTADQITVKCKLNLPQIGKKIIRIWWCCKQLHLVQEQNCCRKRGYWWQGECPGYDPGEVLEHYFQVQKSISLKNSGEQFNNNKFDQSRFETCTGTTMNYNWTNYMSNWATIIRIPSGTFDSLRCTLKLLLNNVFQ